MTSHAGIHAAAIVLPFQLPRASSIIRLSRLRPVNSSAAGSAARRVVVRNILASLLCVLVLVSRLLPDAASSLREVVQPPCRGQAGRFGRFGKPDGRNGRRYLSKWRWRCPTQGAGRARARPGPGQSGAQSLPAELPPEYGMTSEEVGTHREEGEGVRRENRPPGKEVAGPREQSIGGAKKEELEQDHLSQDARSREGTSLHHVGEQEPGGHGRRAEGSGDHTFAQEIVVMAGHGPPEVEQIGRASC